METQKLNLFIVDDNALTTTDLKYYLQNKFGENIVISTFSDGISCLKKVDDSTHIVILDYMMTGINGLDVLKSIKTINSKTEVIMLSGNEDMAIAIQSFRAGATDYVVKGQSAFKKITKLVSHIIEAPIRLIVKEFGVSKYMAIFLLTFVTMLVAVYIALHTHISL